MSARRFTIRRFRFRKRGLQLVGAAVEHQQVGVGDLFHHDLAHVLGIGLKGIGVHKGHHLLIEDPVGGQHLRYSRSMDHMPLYSMRTCLGLYCFSHSLLREQVSDLLVPVTTVTLSEQPTARIPTRPLYSRSGGFCPSRAKPSSKMPLIKSVLPPSSGDEIYRNVSHEFFRLQAEQLCQRFFLLQIGTDDAQAAGV